jgi:hypothetical protein
MCGTEKEVKESKYIIPYHLPERLFGPLVKPDPLSKLRNHKLALPDLVRTYQQLCIIRNGITPDVPAPEYRTKK